MYFGGLSPKEGCTAYNLRPSQCATGSHVGLLGASYMLASVGEGRRGRNSNTIYEAGINIVCLYSFEMAPMEHVATE